MDQVIEFIINYILNLKGITIITIIVMFLYLIIFRYCYYKNINHARYKLSLSIFSLFTIILILISIYVNNVKTLILLTTIIISLMIESILIIKRPLFIERIILNYKLKNNNLNITNYENYFITPKARLDYNVFLSFNQSYFNNNLKSLLILNRIDKKWLLDNEKERLNNLILRELIQLDNINVAEQFIRDNRLDDYSTLFYEALIAYNRLELNKTKEKFLKLEMLSFTNDSVPVDSIYNNLAIFYGYDNNIKFKTELLKRGLQSVVKEKDRLKVHIYYQNLIFCLMVENNEEKDDYILRYNEYVNLKYTIDIFEYHGFLLKYYTVTKDNLNLRQTVFEILKYKKLLVSPNLWIGLFKSTIQFPDLQDIVINIYYEYVNTRDIDVVDKYLFYKSFYQDINKSVNTNNKKLFYEAKKFIEDKEESIDEMILTLDRKEINKITQLRMIKIHNKIKKTNNWTNEIIEEMELVIDQVELYSNNLSIITISLNFLAILLLNTDFIDYKRIKGANEFIIERIGFVESINNKLAKHELMIKVSFDMILICFKIRDKVKTIYYFEIFKSINLFENYVNAQDLKLKKLYIEATDWIIEKVN